MKKVILIILSLTMLNLVSCTKEEDEQDIDVSKTTMVMVGAWQLKEYWITTGEQAPLNFYESMQNCTKDNYYIFDSPQTVTMYEGDNKCVGAPDNVTMFYSLTDDDNVITIWTNPEDPENSIYLTGSVTYPNVDSFVVTFNVFDPVTETNSIHVQGFAKMK